MERGRKVMGRLVNALRHGKVSREKRSMWTEFIAFLRERCKVAANMFTILIDFVEFLMGNC
jgi:hypothetical protein